MKRITAISLAVLLLLSALLGLSSCGGNKKLPLNDYYSYLTDFENDESDWAKSIRAAADAVKASSTTGNSNLYIPKGVYEINGMLQIPVGVNLIFEEGAIFKLGAEATFNMNGRNIIAPKTQIFDVADGAKIMGSGFFSASVGCPEWFGAKVNDDIDDSKAINYAVGCFATVEFSEGTYNVDKNVDLNTESKTHTSLIINGAGKDKTVLKVAPNVKCFFFDGSKVFYYLIEIRNIGFEEVGGGRTGMAISVRGATPNASPKAVITDCSFKGFNTAFDTGNSGFVHFNNNYAENNEVVCEIGGGAMFLFYKYNKAVSNGYFLRCDIPANGGYSNGIDIVENEVSKSEQYDIFIKENQAVFIEKCSFTDGKGEASVYLASVSDFRITDTVITSSPEAPERVAYYNKNSHSGYIYNCDIKNNGTGLFFDGPRSWRCMTYVNSCTFENNSVNDINLKSMSDIKIVGNDFKTAFSHSGKAFEIKISDVRVKNVVIAENTFASKSAHFGDAFGSDRTTEFGNVFNG